MNAPHSLPTSSPKSSNLLALLCMSAALACGLTSAAMAAAADTDADALVAEISGALAGEIEMNNANLALSAPIARLARTARTPSQVDIDLPIAMGQTVCAQYAQVPRTGQNGAMCGYDRVVRRVCRDLPSSCRIDPRTHRRICTPRGRECHNEVITQARVCTWMETVCVRTEVRTSAAAKKVRLKFKKVAPLAAGEVEIYELRGAQKHVDSPEAVFSLTAIATKAPVSIKARDGIGTGFKDIITIKGE